MLQSRHFLVTHWPVSFIGLLPIVMLARLYFDGLSCWQGYTMMFLLSFLARKLLTPAVFRSMFAQYSQTQHLILFHQTVLVFFGLHFANLENETFTSLWSAWNCQYASWMVTSMYRLTVPVLLLTAAADGSGWEMSPLLKKLEIVFFISAMRDPFLSCTSSSDRLLTQLYRKLQLMPNSLRTLESWPLTPLILVAKILTKIARSLRWTCSCCA